MPITQVIVIAAMLGAGIAICLALCLAIVTDSLPRQAGWEELVAMLFLAATLSVWLGDLCTESQANPNVELRGAAH